MFLVKPSPSNGCRRASGKVGAPRGRSENDPHVVERVPSNDDGEASAGTPSGELEERDLRHGTRRPSAEQRLDDGIHQSQHSSRGPCVTYASAHVSSL